MWRGLKALVRTSRAYADDAHEHDLARLPVVSQGAIRVIESIKLRVNLVAFEHALRIDPRRTATRAGEVRRRDAAAPSCCP